MTVEPLIAAVLYHKHSPPAKNGIVKPMKAGGYAVSSADIDDTLRL